METKDFYDEKPPLNELVWMKFGPQGHESDTPNFIEGLVKIISIDPGGFGGFEVEHYIILLNHNLDHKLEVKQDVKQRIKFTKGLYTSIWRELNEEETFMFVL